MKNTIEYWNKQKRHLMKVLRYARAVKSKKGIETYSNAVNRCDIKIGVISTMRRVFLVGLFFYLILAMSGCISNTLDGMRQDIHNASAPGAQARWVK